MALTTTQCRVGAIVDVTHNKTGEPLKVRKRGVISKVFYEDGSENGSEAYNGTGIKRIFVRFDDDGRDIRVLPRCCALFKPFDRRRYDRLKSEQETHDARDIESALVLDHRDPEDKPVISNKAELDKKQSETVLKAQGLIADGDFNPEDPDGIQKELDEKKAAKEAAAKKKRLRKRSKG